MDPRLMERRRAVAEDHAKRNVGRLLRTLGLIIVAGSVLWAAFSPWLSVSQVRMAGISSSDAHRILAEKRVIAGTPMVMLRPRSIESSLKEDPWIREARVHLDWPNEVIVRIDERVPVAWVNTGDQWTRRAIDGMAIPSPTNPDRSLPWVQLPGLGSEPAADSPFVLGAAAFAANLPKSKWEGVTVRLEGNELWAVVDGYQVQLGRPVEMEAKALSLVALLEEEIPTGSVLVLVAPTHPAVRPPTKLDDDGEPSPDLADEG